MSITERRDRQNPILEEMLIARGRSAQVFDSMSPSQLAEVGRFYEQSFIVDPQKSLVNRMDYEGDIIPDTPEAVLATLKMKEVAEQLVSQVPDNAGLLCIGSFAWGRYYAPKMNFETRKVQSDLDFDVIMDDCDIDGIAAFLAEIDNPDMDSWFKFFASMSQAGLVDYFSHKVEINGVNVSIHVTPSQTLEKLAEYKASKGNDLYLSEFRTKPKSKKPEYVLKSFSGKSINHTCDVEIESGYQLTNVPAFQMNQGELMLGVVPDKYLHKPLILNDRGKVTSNIAKLRKNVVSRILEEEQQFGDPRSLSKGLSRLKRTPIHVVNQIDMEESATRGQILRGING